MAMNTTGGTVVANGTSTTTMSTMLNAHAVLQFLVRALPYLVFEKFGQAYPLPERSTKTVKFRRYEALDATPTTLAEGVTPTSQNLTTTDISATLNQYGSLVTITDVLNDTSDTPVLQQAAELIGEQAAEMIERMRIGVLLGGSNVEYANGTARSAVVKPISLDLQRRIVRKLKNQRARFINTIVQSTPRFNTENVAPGFVAVCHPDVESDIRDMTHFIDTKDYGTVPPMENEIGAVEHVRYLFTTLMDPYRDAGAAISGASPAVVSTTGTKADVYPVLYIAKDAYGLVPFKGANAVTPIILNPTPSASDPLGQRGHVAWKSMQTAVILNQSWMVRAEVAVTAK
jgi:N4-gp56 family major capsid protein